MLSYHTRKENKITLVENQWTYLLIITLLSICQIGNNVCFKFYNSFYGKVLINLATNTSHKEEVKLSRIEINLWVKPKSLKISTDFF